MACLYVCVAAPIVRRAPTPSRLTTTTHPHTHIDSLSQPLHPEAAALVRQIYRRCWTLRASLPPQPPAAVAVAGGEEGEGEERRGHLARLNTLIAVTGIYFRQGEGEGETAAVAMAGGEGEEGVEMEEGRGEGGQEQGEGEEEEDEEEGEIVEGE